MLFRSDGVVRLPRGNSMTSVSGGGVIFDKPRTSVAERMLTKCEAERGPRIVTYRLRRVEERLPHNGYFEALQLSDTWRSPRTRPSNMLLRGYSLSSCSMESRHPRPRCHRLR